MRTIFETTTVIAGRIVTRDFDDKTEATSHVESVGEGRIVTFIRDFDGRDRSCAMETFVSGAWRGVDISR